MDPAAVERGRADILRTVVPDHVGHGVIAPESLRGHARDGQDLTVGGNGFRNLDPAGITAFRAEFQLRSFLDLVIEKTVHVGHVAVVELILAARGHAHTEGRAAGVEVLGKDQPLGRDELHVHHVVGHVVPVVVVELAVAGRNPGVLRGRQDRRRTVLAAQVQLEPGHALAVEDDDDVPLAGVVALVGIRHLGEHTAESAFDGLRRSGNQAGEQQRQTRYQTLLDHNACLFFIR